MPRRLAVARRAGGFDSIGWTLLGFLLGASLAVFALLHADVHALTQSAIGSPAPAPAAPVVRYTPPAVPAPLLAGMPQAPPALVSAPSTSAPQAATPSTPSTSALASAGAASAHAAKAPAPAVAARAPAAAGSDAQVADDAAAAGMTSRSVSGAPTQGQDLF